MSRKGSFDTVAWVYDGLAKAVFGKSIIESQLIYLDKIPKDAHVLFLGGGTGWLAKKLLQLNSTCSIVYVEASSSMLMKSRERMSTNDLDRIHFVQSTEIPRNETFDVIITNFFLDLFRLSNLEDVVFKIESSLNQNGLWIITDFVDGGKWWQRLLLKTMYMFFRITTGIQTTSLPPWENTVHRNGMNILESKVFYGGFIKTQITKHI